MSRVLVTGSLGLVGSATVALFKEKDWEVVGIDNNMRHHLFGTKEQDDEEFIQLDIRNEQGINELFKKIKFDAIVHTAGQPSHDFSKDEPLLDFYINVLGTLNLLEATRLYAPKATFVFVSTDKVYGEGMRRDGLVETETRYNCAWPFDETTPVEHMISPFGCGKLAADHYVQEYGYQYDIKTACFRPGCITGKNHQGAEMHGFLSYLAKCIKEGKTYKIFGFKGKQVRDQIHASDLANAFWEFIQNPKVAAVYNMGGGPERSVSVLEAGELISQQLGKPFAYEFHEERLADRQWDVHDVSKFKTDYPTWEYKYSLKDIISDVCSV